MSDLELSSLRRMQGAGGTRAMLGDVVALG